MMEDAELLARYVDEGSEQAFAELVRHNLDLVYATALRHVGDAHRAEDIAQSVFIDLARKAKALRGHPTLVSWLYTSTRYAALKAIRTEQRRTLREQEAQTMHETLSPEPVLDWAQLRPLLDEALNELNEADRQAILLRYFRGLRFAEVAHTLRLSEGATRNRVDRALDKLNTLLTERGVSSTGAALGVALAAQPVVAAPAGLAAAVTTAALTGAGVGATGLLGTLFVMSKFKIAAVTAIVLGGLATAVIEVRANRTLREELRTIGHDDRSRLQQENDRLRAATATLAAANPEIEELTKVRARISAVKARPEGVVEEEIRIPRNLGRATPAAAMETFCWAIDQNDLDLVAPFVSFSDDTPENRAAFMAHFSEAVRTRYQTPERLCAAAFFGTGAKREDDHPVAVQVFSVEEDHGPDHVKVKIWWRTTLGHEAEGVSTMAIGPGGWTLKPVALGKASILKEVLERIDPVSGDFVSRKSSTAQANR